jgi:ferritin-like metal-binding protein YciE
MDQEILQELFIDHIRDLYDAEKQIVKALPKLAKAAESEDLAQGLRKHLEETQNHVARLEEVFKMAGIAAKGKPCKGMKGLIEEGNEAVQEHDEGPLRDLAIIGGAQKVEHYEMSAYGTACAIAEQLGMNDAIELLRQTEGEEKAADEALTQAATSLYEAQGSAEEGEEETEEDEEAMPVGASRSSRATPAKNSSRKTAKR